MSYARFRQLLLAAVFLSGGAAASAGTTTQGSLGFTSTGTVAVSASVPNRVKLSGLSDVAFTNQDPASAASKPQDVCVWSNTSTKGYHVTATGDGTGGAFTLAAGTLTVPYSVEWAASSGQTSGTALATGTQLTGLTSTAVNPDCTSGPSKTASLIVDIAASDLQSMQAQTSYTGTLTLVVGPE